MAHTHAISISEDYTSFCNKFFVVNLYKFDEQSRYHGIRTSKFIQVNDLEYKSFMGWGGVMEFNVTFNNILIISWWSVLLVEETEVPGEKTTDLQQVTDKLDHIMLYRVHLA